MELNRLRPYGFETLSEIMNKHITQVHRHLFRYFFTEEEFITGNLPTNWSKFALLFFNGIFDIIVVSCLIGAAYNSLPYFKQYNQLVGQSFGVSEPEKISFSYLIVIICLLDCVYMTVTWLVKKNIFFIRVLYEFRRNLDNEIKNVEVRKNFLWFFNMASYLTGVNYKAMTTGMIFLVSMVFKTAVVNVWNGASTMTLALQYTVLFAASQLQFGILQYIAYALLCGLFFVLKVFKYRTNNCLRMSAQLSKHPKTTTRTLDRFYNLLMDTHRLICWYNAQIREYNFCMDCLSNLATTWALVNVLRSPDIIGFVFCVLFFSMYLYSHSMGERMAFYKDMTGVMNKQIHTFAAEHSKPKLMKMPAQRKLDRLMKANKSIAFLADNNNQFGFTYGRQYMYTKLRVIQNISFYVYVLMLLYRNK